MGLVRIFWVVGPWDLVFCYYRCLVVLSGRSPVNSAPAPWLLLDPSALVPG